MKGIEITIYLILMLVIGVMLSRLFSRPLSPTSTAPTGMKLKTLLDKGWGTPDVLGGGYSLYFSKDHSKRALVHDVDDDVLVIHNVKTDEVLWEAKYNA